MAQVATFNPLNRVVMWGRETEIIKSINENNVNHEVFPEHKLSTNITATTDLDEALKDTELVVGCVPAQVLPIILEENKDKIPLSVPFVNCAKGKNFIFEKFIFFCNEIK